MRRMEWTEGDVQVNGVQLHYYRGGTGTPVVLAHGFSDNGKCWERVATVLDDRYDVIAYDARYHGKSDAPGDGSMGDGADLVGLVEALELEKPAAVGHSMGAGTVAQAVGMRPELFRCAVLEDPAWRDDWPNQANRPQPPKWNEMPLEQAIELGKQQSPHWNDAEFPAWAESKQQMRIPVDWATRRPMALGNWRERVAAIGVPTLLIRGGNVQRGRIVDDATAAAAQEMNARIESVCLAQAGHNIRREAFPEYVAAVNAFLGRHC